MTARDSARLRAAIAMLQAMCDPSNENCGLPADVKRRVAPYVRSWVLPRVQDALAERPWRDSSERSCVESDMAKMVTT